MSVYMAVTKGEASLSHHGILGQKWGIRRYQNPDGTLTPEGLKRYQRFDSKNFKKEKHEQYEKEGRSKLMSTVNASSAKDMAKQYDKMMYRYLKQQARVEQKMSKAKAIGDEKAYSRLIKKWIATQSQIIMADKLARNIDSNLASYQSHQSAISMMGPIGGVIDAALPGSYFREVLKAGGKETSDQALKDYNKRFNKTQKINTASNAKQSTDILSKEQIDSKVASARKTGKYDMEFLERELDLDQRTGELLKGKALDDAYRKYLNSKSAVQDRANYDIKAVRNAPTNKERNEALSGAAREAKRTGVYATGFKDSSFYINPETGKPLTGKALDSAYKKWLIEQM